jgi:hypothetical protein
MAGWHFRAATGANLARQPSTTPQAHSFALARACCFWYDIEQALWCRSCNIWARAARAARWPCRYPHRSGQPRQAYTGLAVPCRPACSAGGRRHGARLKATRLPSATHSRAKRAARDYGDAAFADRQPKASGDEPVAAGGHSVCFATSPCGRLSDASCSGPAHWHATICSGHPSVSPAARGAHRWSAARHADACTTCFDTGRFGAARLS